MPSLLQLSDSPFVGGDGKNSAQKCGRNVPRPSSCKVRRPATIKRNATTKRAQPGNLMPAYFCKSHAVSGHADKPENRANQPLVGGQGPNVMMSPKPPPPATIVHPQATIKPNQRTSRRSIRRCSGQGGEVVTFNEMTFGSVLDFDFARPRSAVLFLQKRQRVALRNAGDFTRLSEGAR